MPRVRLMDNEFTNLCRMRRQMMDVMATMRKVLPDEVDSATLGRFREQCSTLRTENERIIAGLTPLSEVRGIGGTMSGTAWRTTQYETKSNDNIV